MKLLIITQKVNINDSVLGFFHEWIIKFAKYYEEVVVICLEAGEYHLPNNVRVLSLGKEKNADLRGLQRGFTRIKYLFNFYKYIWQERKNYDTVFVHMNQEYVLLGGLFWLFAGKKIMMWRNHLKGNLLTNIAVFLSNKVFCTSKESYTARFKKTQIMPVGIDTDLFKNISNNRVKNSLLILGRIAPVKKLEVIIDALSLLKKEGIFFTTEFVGDALLLDMDYLRSLEDMIKRYELSEMVFFKKGIPNTETPNIYNKFEVFINATPSGSMDKTIFEAMACGALPITPNKSLVGVVDNSFIFKENDSSDLSEKIKRVIFLDEKQKNIYREKNRSFVVEYHSLDKLVEALFLNSHKSDK